MKRNSFSPGQDFTVREEKLLNIILAVLLTALFIYGLVDAIRSRFHNMQTFGFILLFALAPAIVFFTKARSKRVYLRVNKHGIFVDEVMLTNWPLFLNAYVHEAPAKYIRIRDNFELVIEHLREDSDKGFRKRIKLTNTQNKSEEDIIAAIKFFWSLSQAQEKPVT